MDAHGHCSYPHHHSTEKSIGKIPICGEGWPRQRFTREQIIAEWTQYPTANVGVLLEPSNLLVIDPDSTEAIEEVVAKGLPPGPHVRTGRGVQHYFSNPKNIIGLAIRRGESHQIDILAKGIVIGFGSIHRSGKRYQLLTSWEEWPLEEPPLWAEALLLESLKRRGDAEEIPDRLPSIDLDALGLSPWLQFLIRHGQPERGEEYPSRSEPLWAVVTSLVGMGHDTATIASLLLDPHFAISAKPREQGTRWLAGEIGRARAKVTLIVKDTATNGTRPHDALTDEEENDITTAQEREPLPENGAEKATSTPTYPCPDILWQGIFRTVAEKLDLWTWEVWLGTFGALCARAHRNLHCHYHSDHIYGNSYTLLVNATGRGKNLVVNLVRALLGEEYKIRSGLNSGPALLPMLTDDSLKAKDGRLEVRGVPVVLLSSEWSRLAQMSGIEHATLQEDLNDIFMRHYPWSQARSHKNPSGGDIVLTNPTLTVVGTTTRKLFHSALTARALGSGTINRYLIVPGSAVFQKYTGKAYRADHAVAGLLDALTTRTFGAGQEIRELYSPEAWEAFASFQDAFIVPLNNDPDASEALMRLHVHLQHIAALYAWQSHAERIELAHYGAAQAIIETSHRFVSELLAERAAEYEPTIVQVVDSAMEQRALTILRKYPGLTRREFARKVMTEKGGYAAWVKIVDSLVKAGAITTKKNGQREELYVLSGF